MAWGAIFNSPDCTQIEKNMKICHKAELLREGIILIIQICQSNFINEKIENRKN